jgi:hypothetical protein
MEIARPIQKQSVLLIFAEYIDEKPVAGLELLEKYSSMGSYKNGVYRTKPDMEI